jgi:hypothetical protein
MLLIFRIWQNDLSGHPLFMYTFDHRESDKIMNICFSAKEITIFLDIWFYRLQTLSFSRCHTFK